MLQVARMVTQIELVTISRQTKPGRARPVRLRGATGLPGDLHRRRSTDINALVAKHVNKRSYPCPVLPTVYREYIHTWNNSETCRSCIRDWCRASGTCRLAIACEMEGLFGHARHGIARQQQRSMWRKKEAGACRRRPGEGGKEGRAMDRRMEML